MEALIDSEEIVHLTKIDNNITIFCFSSLCDRSNAQIKNKSSLLQETLLLIMISYAIEYGSHKNYPCLVVFLMFNNKDLA